MVKDAERKLGVTLPNSYIGLCKIQNGGYIIHKAHPTTVPTNWAVDHVSVDNINGISDEGILSSNYYIEEWDLPKELVLLCGDGNTWIAMDYQSTKENHLIIYIDLEWTEETFILELAPNFDTFFKNLYTMKINWKDGG
ncbi:SMI1/KNR4 family protein [Sutcliffiella rhizosphaerae]|uniref:Knr4/Smi1-like domain-containing protein n=1 Tax=Sutcliffiella rhizosphaerae TaxID=2880967 RepID=A0ABM8YP10_9BACI|nr:SMI1/KNR4 family protein [Sutcliffiella rhizosphaerae]CAG9621530.1 hypothetical protein BACCIP111883_02303 [Sutcliffiella rhizosphaerae]